MSAILRTQRKEPWADYVEEADLRFKELVSSIKLGIVTSVLQVRAQQEAEEAKEREAKSVSGEGLDR